MALHLGPALARAAEGFRLSAPGELIETGFLKYVLPRFSLKTGVRIEVLEDAAEAEVTLAPSGAGRPVFSGPERTWHMRIAAPDHEGVQRFAGWLSSEIGQRTITSFEIDGETVFSLPDQTRTQAAEVSFDGDAAAGARLSTRHCGRCHVVDPDKRMGDIGSTPSFAVLRALRDWDDRFQSFYVRNPHPAFTQIEDVTRPFPIDRPPPIVPVELTLDEVEAILAFVSGIQPADLGAPIQHQ